MPEPSSRPHRAEGVRQRPSRLGEKLVRDGVLTPEALDRVMEAQERSGAGLGEVLVANGYASSDAIAAAVAEEWGLGHADLDAEPPDPALAGTTDVETVLRHRILPWRRVGKLTVYATCTPAHAATALGVLEPESGMALVVVVPPDAFDRAALDLYRAELASRAALRAPKALSVRALDGARHGMLTALLAGALSSIVLAEHVLAALGFLVLLLGATTTATRLAALMFSRPAPRFAGQPGTVALADRRVPPKISLLVPLYREAQMIPRIVAALERLDYPRECLDVKLLLEEDDDVTRAAVERMALPAWITGFVVPAGAPRTKPRALNAALDFCDGEIIGILDAEDRPDPDQLRAVAGHLHTAPRDVAAVQCQLAYFNAAENWITRCFQIEYAIWFNVLLRGWQRLGLPIPLGGTSVYFRRETLVALGGWDAHNVTEDADLGMRLARQGYRCDVLSSTTEEEANCRFTPWIRQRSRWLKGYMMTWLSHMRSPGRLWRELGPAGFLGFQVLLLGGAVSYLAMPLFWVALFMTLMTGQPVYGPAMPGWALVALSVTLVSGQAVMLAAAALALRRRGAPGLIWWVPSLLLYWTMGAVAAWKAVIELGFAPYYWDKTRHGVSRVHPSQQK